MSFLIETGSSCISIIQIWNWNCLLWILEYRLISKKGEGTFSEVLKAQSTKTNKYVAIKCMKAHFYNIDQVGAPLSSRIPDE